VAITLALPQFAQRSRLTKDAIGAVELTPNGASAGSSRMPSWRQCRQIAPGSVFLAGLQRQASPSSATAATRPGEAVIVTSDSNFNALLAVD
jgi:hypothetical protein